MVSQLGEDPDDRETSNAFLTALDPEEYDRYNDIKTEVTEVLAGKLTTGKRQNFE